MKYFNKLRDKESQLEKELRKQAADIGLYMRETPFLGISMTLGNLTTSTTCFRLTWLCCFFAVFLLFFAGNNVSLVHPPCVSQGCGQNDLSVALRPGMRFRDQKYRKIATNQTSRIKNLDNMIC
jgi:hypothetical protein